MFARISMNKFALITGAGAREGWRWAREHLYAILILSPLVAGMTYATLVRVASYAPDDWRPPLALCLTLAMLAEATLVGLSLSRASAEIYHLRTPETLLDALPVSLSTHLHAALAKRIARTSAASVVVLVARSLLNGDEALSVSSFVALALWIMLTALAATLAALQWIHWGHTREKRQLIRAALALLPVNALAASLMLRVVKPALLVGINDAWLDAGGVLCGAALYALVRYLHERWRGADIEYAKRLQTAGRRSLFRARIIKRFGGPPVAAQIARDLQLTLRAFSSAVYVALIFAVLWTALLVVSLTTRLIPLNVVLPPAEGAGTWLDATLLLPVVCAKVACVFAVMSLLGVLPSLVSYQLPHLWLERATGAAGRDMWQAKLWYARLVTLPAPLVVWALSVASGAIPLLYVAPLLAECLWLWWLMSSLAGGLAFELPEQPGLALILMIFAGLSAGLLTAWLWPLGLLAGMVIAQTSERGPHRASFLLLTEGD
jgi:hypothetical protein